MYYRKSNILKFPIALILLVTSFLFLSKNATSQTPQAFENLVVGVNIAPSFTGSHPGNSFVQGSVASIPLDGTVDSGYVSYDCFDLGFDDTIPFVKFDQINIDMTGIQVFITDSGNNVVYDRVLDLNSDWAVQDVSNSVHCGDTVSDFVRGKYLVNTSIPVQTLVPGTYNIEFAVNTTTSCDPGANCNVPTSYPNLTFTVTSGSGPSGTICVNSNIVTSWTMQGSQSLSGGGTTACYPGLLTGDYTANGATVGGYSGPVYSPSQTMTLGDGQTITFNLAYTSTGGGQVCNNGIVEGTEQCDNGGSNGACPSSCSTSCTTNSCGGVCGNGVVESGEQCDIGGSNGACPSTCSSSCTNNSCAGPPCNGAWDVGLRMYQDGAARRVGVYPSGALSSPLRVYKDIGFTSSIWAVVLVPPGSPNASRMYVQTPGGKQALCIF